MNDIQRQIPNILVLYTTSRFFGE